MKEHPVFLDWKIKKEGGLICTNKKKLDAQKGVIVKIAGSVRRLLMSGRSPLSISLPVGVFS